MPTLTVTDVTKSFGRTRALRGVSVSLDAGITGLLGPNGAGKTTLLRILATILPPDAGSVRILGRAPGEADGRLSIRRRLGYLPQDLGLYPRFTVFEFVDYVAILKEMTDRRARHEEVRRVIALVGLEAVARRRIKALSGGMRRRAGLAQALLGDPDLLVLDEPTAGLDPEQRLRFRELISRIGEQRTVLLSTHLTEDVAALGGRVVVLHQGHMRFDGRPRELATLARGRVWTADERDPRARLAWRNGEGTFRHIGEPPADARLVPPTMEDAYLLIAGERADAAEGVRA
jgi:ABC-2 type transport system ATP-binding protein